MSTSTIKYRWYETDAKVVVEIPVKNVLEESVNVHFDAEQLAVRASSSTDGECALKLELRHAVLPDECSFRVRPTKIEINLAKVMHSRWEKLERENEPQPKCSTQPKNWDKLVNDLGGKDEEDSVNSLFSKIYEEGNEDQKRAMLKSFTESGGTVLSTNWDEVGKKKVEVKPPEGAEFKPWN